MDETCCRFCGEVLKHSFANLGMSPFANAYLWPDQLNDMEPFYPLHAYVCSNCFLVQLAEFQSSEQIFSDYAYFSSYSRSWLQHARDYADKMVKLFNFDPSSSVIEIASNDGYLLQYFQQKNIPVLGIEPAANVASVAQAAGIPTQICFFGKQTALELREMGHRADLLLGNNVLAHVPDINDFVEGMKLLLKPHGVITMEFPHLLNLLKYNQFDTIYHEHFSYLSLLSVEKIFAHHGLTIFDVEELPTHGGSLRIYACHDEDERAEAGPAVQALKQREVAQRLDSLDTYEHFAKKVQEVKRQLLAFLIEAKSNAKSVVAYGAPAKGNTLLNYCGIRTDFIDYTVDLSPHKQGSFLPGTHIPVHHPDKIRQTRPDYVLILPWNLQHEIVEQMADVRNWGGKFVVPIPALQVVS